MINFDEQTHTYTNEKGKVLISVTQLLKLAGISPNYDFVNEEVLKAAADKGSLIHKEIEDYIKKGEIGFTTELHEFITYVKEQGIKVLASEKQVYNDRVAGTIDLIFQYPNGKVVYADFKTTSTIHKQAVSYQLSIYKDLDKDSEHEIDANYEDAGLEVWHFLNDGSLEVRSVMEIAKPALDRLYESITTGKPLEKTEEEKQFLKELYDAEKVIAYYENEKKLAEENRNKVRDKIIEIMKAQGITKFENDNISITYIAPTDAETFDSKRFKEENPNTYQEYVKITHKKESVRITLKEKKNE